MDTDALLELPKYGRVPFTFLSHLPSETRPRTILDSTG